MATRTATDPEQVRTRAKGCPPWCEDPHDRPGPRGTHWERQHFAFLTDGADPHTKQHVRLYRTDEADAPGSALLQLALYGEATFLPAGGCAVALTVGEARALAKTLLEAAKLLGAADQGWGMDQR